MRPRPQPLNPKPSNKCRLYKLMLKLETLHTQVIDQDNKGYKSQPNYLGSLVSSNVGCTPPFSRTFLPNHSMLSPPDSGFHLALHNKMRTRSTGTRLSHWQKDEDEEADNLIYLNSCGFSLKYKNSRPVQNTTASMHTHCWNIGGRTNYKHNLKHPKLHFSLKTNYTFTIKGRYEVP